MSRKIMIGARHVDYGASLRLIITQSSIPRLAGCQGKKYMRIVGDFFREESRSQYQFLVAFG